MFRQLSAPQLAFDLVLALVCVSLRLAIGTTLPLAIVVIVMGAALALNRVSPPLALGVAWAGAIMQMLFVLTPDAANLAILVVLYSAARHGGRVTRWLGLASAIVGAVVAAVYVTFVIAAQSLTTVAVQAGSTYALVAFAVLGLSWTIGFLMRTRNDALLSRRAKAAAERSVVVEQERNRIARDMHDVVAHSLAVVIAQADGARYASDAATKDASLATISGTAREALADVRLLLGQLRHQQEAGPQPVLGDLDRLVSQLRSSGLLVRLHRDGDVSMLPTATQLALYRIAQEALTNALRHGDTEQEVDLRLVVTPDVVELTVASALRGEPEVHEGHGLPGMRERAVLVGGTLSAGRRGDRWVVLANIPIGEVAT